MTPIVLSWPFDLLIKRRQEQSNNAVVMGFMSLIEHLS
jgi:hypothetical protein